MRKWLLVGCLFITLGLAAAAGVYAAPVMDGTLTPHLVAYWPLDEAAGTRHDAHGAHHLTDNNTVGYATGILTQSAAFSAANYEYLSILSDDFTIATGDLTLAAWVRLDVLGGTAPIFERDGEYNVNIENNHVVFTLAKMQRITAATSLNVASWYHIAAIFDATGDAMRLYVNGLPSPTATFTATPSNYGAPLRIGRDSAHYLNGRVDAVGVWRRALTASEISDLYNNGIGVAYPFGEAVAPGPYRTYLPLVASGPRLLPPNPTPAPTPENPYEPVTPLDFSADQTWWDWANVFNGMVSPVYSMLWEIGQSIGTLTHDMCAIDMGMFLAADNYDTLIELQLGADPSLQAIAYSLGVSLGRPVGWIRAAIAFTRDIGAWYLTALLYFILAGMSWIAFVVVFTYSIRFARFALEFVIRIYELIPFKAT